MIETDKINSRASHKYLQLAEHFKGKMECGDLRPGDRLPSFVQMREKFGATAATVERLYGLLDKEGLIERQARRGTFVANPRTSRMVGVGAIGMAAHESALHNPYYAPLLRGIQETALASDKEILLLGEKSKVQWEKIDGILLMGINLTAYSLPPGMPRIALLQGVEGITSVQAEDSQGSRALTQHLLEFGHQRIAMLSIDGQANSDTVPGRRIIGYREALAAASIAGQPEWMKTLRRPHSVYEPFDFTERGRAVMEQWLQSDWEETGCTAIMAYNDDVAIGVIEALEHAGHRVPGDVSVTGFDGILHTRYYRPKLTTIEVPLREIGASGTQILLKQIAEPLETVIAPHQIATLSLSSPLRKGESTGVRK